MHSIVFRRWHPDERPLHGELWLRPSVRAGDSVALARAVCEHGLAALDAGSGSIASLVVSGDDEHPTFDEMLATHFAQRLLAGGTLTAADGALAKYAELLRQGKRPTELAPVETIEGIFLAMRQRDGGNLCEPEAAGRFLADWRRLANRLDAAAAQSSDFFRQSPFLDAAEFADERTDLINDERAYRSDVTRGERWCIRLNNAKADCSGLLLREPQSVMFPFWSRHDRETPTGEPYAFLAVTTGGGGWVFSTDPALRLSLAGLATELRAAEANATKKPAAATSGSAGNSADEVWYDGIRHGHTLVAARRGDSRLSEHEVLRVVKRWTKARIYVRPRPLRPVQIALLAAAPAFLATAIIVAAFTYLSSASRFRFAEVAPAVVRIQVGQEQGTGFFISPDGWLVTNHHVIHGVRSDPTAGGARTLDIQRVQMDGDQVQPQPSPAKAVIYKDDPKRDLALLKLIDSGHGKRGIQYVKLASPQSKIVIGSSCWAVGNPVEHGNSLNMLASGTISSIEKTPVPTTEIEHPPVLARLIHSRCNLSPGCSGGPLLDSAGRVIGVTVGISGLHGDTMHIHLADLRDFLGDIAKVPAAAPLYVPSDRPRFVTHGLIDFDRDGRKESVVFADLDEEQAGKQQPTGFWVDLDGHSRQYTQEDLDDPARDPVCQGQWKHHLALIVEPWPTVFYDDDADGQYELILQGPKTEAGELIADQQWTFSAGQWRLEVPPLNTPLLSAERFAAGPLRQSFQQLLTPLTKRLRRN